MHKSSMSDALHAGRRCSLLTLGILAVLTALVSFGATPRKVRTRKPFSRLGPSSESPSCCRARTASSKFGSPSRHLSRIFSFSTTRSSAARHPTGRSRPLNSAAPRWMAARPCICRAPNTMVMALSSARSRASSHSADPAARATTSTTTGANLLVSGAGPGSADASVIKYDFVRPNAQATTLEALRLGQVWSGKGSPPGLGGD